MHQKYRVNSLIHPSHVSSARKKARSLGGTLHQESVCQPAVCLVRARFASRTKRSIYIKAVYGTHFGINHK